MFEAEEETVLIVVLCWLDLFLGEQVQYAQMCLWGIWMTKFWQEVNVFVAVLLICFTPLKKKKLFLDQVYSSGRSIVKADAMMRDGGLLFLQVK